MNKISNLLQKRSLKVSRLLSLSINQNVQEKIDIPKRISRGPTDLLRAIESTVQKDPTAAHYKYHDDPYFIPMSNIGKRTFAMAQEAGRKAAHWVRAQHPELFQHHEANPEIQMFFPKMFYGKDTNVTEEDLKNTIKDVLVSDAVNVYTLLKEKGVEISDETRLGLLDLLCFFNNEDTLPEEFIEERWFRQSSRGKEKLKKTWRDGTLAEEIFISIDNPDTATYSSIIQGMAKHYQVDRAWQLYEEAHQKNLILNTEAYNAIINVANYLKEGYDLRWTLIKNILSTMNLNKVKPNVGTLNSVLEMISTLGNGKNNKVNALRVINEFKNMGIEPSLGTYYFLLITFCKERGPISGILRDILPHLENKEHKIQDIKDTYFFVTAMDICKNHLHDKELAGRVHKLLHFGNNYDLIGNSFKESIYYRHYLTLFCQTEPLNEFMEKIYFDLVPHIYVPEPSVIMEILKCVELNSAIEYLPKLWSDMTIFDHIDRENLVTKVLNIIIENKVEEKQELNEQFSNIAWSIWNKVESQREDKINKISFTGEMLGQIMIVLLRNNDFEKACLVMDKLDRGQHTVVGVPQISALRSFIDNCITEKSPSKAIQCIQYAADCGFTEANDFTIELNKKLTLDETHLSKLSKIVGDHVIKASISESEESAKK